MSVSASDSPPFLLKYWWLPPALLVVAGAIAAWFYREEPIAFGLVSSSFFQSPGPLETRPVEPPAGRVAYRSRVIIETQGQRVESRIDHVVEHLGGGWIRRSEDWYDGGAPRATYQERYLSYRGIVNVYQKHREMAPIVHDVLAEFGWLADTALTHAAETKGAFPEEEGSSLSVRQARLAPTDAQTLVPKQVKYDRHIDCRREGSVDGGTLGPALAGPLARVRCESRRSDLPGESQTIYVWHPQARIFLLVQSQRATPLGGTETQTRRFDSFSISP